MFLLFTTNFLCQDQEKVKRKKVLAQKLEDTSIVSPAVPEKVLSESHDHASSLMAKLVQSAAVSEPEPYVPMPVVSNSSVDKPKKDRVKASPNSNLTGAMPVEVLPKKKVKKKQNLDAAEAQLRLETAPEAEEKHKHHKPTAVPPKFNLQPGAKSGSDSDNRS